jgi:hypothetical protein
MMNHYKKTFVILCAFIISNVVIYNHIDNNNAALLDLQESSARTFTVEEVNPDGMDNLKQALGSKVDALALLNDLTRSKTVILHPNKNPFPQVSFSYFFVVLSLLTSLSLFLINEKKVAKKIQDPLFMESLAGLEYPVLLVNSSLKVIWQNSKSSLMTYSPSKMEEIFDETLDGSEITLDSKGYSVLVTEMNFKTTKHYLAHLIPKTQLLKTDGPRNTSKSDSLINS